MYRKASGGIGFSFNRFMTNAVPNFASDDPERDADLTLNEKDAFWTHQVSGAQTAQRSPMTLDAESALKAGITPHAKVSARIHKELVKNGVIDPSAPLGIDTTRITPKFAHQLAFVSVAVQRKVGLGEIETAMGVDGISEEEKKELTVRLESVKMRKALKPSQRATVQNSGHREAAELPQYS
ncbi:hypothetical protein AYO22_00068 [Fonsecaea multimorphosa]|nr:hypothetical protein AYO22_00068 [Fonsecaea multimorphosa]